MAFELEFFIRKTGAKISFEPIVAFGKNTAIPHHHTGDSKLEKDQFVLLDFGVKYQDYCSDMTRTVFFGSPTKEHQKIYQIVLDAQKAAVDFIKKNLKQNQEIKAQDVDKIAREYIISKGYPIIPHSLGHGIGLQVHERPFLSPKSQDILKPGMIFSIEPGIYIPEFGGVRIEDLYLLDYNALHKLTNSSHEFRSI